MGAYVSGGVVMEPPRVGDLLARAALLYPDKVAVVDGPRRFTYRDLNRRVNALANALAGLGVRKGDRVAILMPNRCEFLEVLFAAAKLGAIAVPINLRLAPPEVQFILSDSGACVLFYDALLEPLARHAAAGTAVRALVEARDGPVAGTNPPASAESRPLQYEALLEPHLPAAREPEAQISFFDPHLMMYTSGTTGRPKGAILTHSNSVWNAVNMLLNEEGLETRDVVLTVAPMFHIGGLSVYTLPALFKGCTVVLERQFDPRRTLELVERERITVLFLVPAMWQAVMWLPDFDRYDLSSLRSLVSGGAPCPLTVIQFFQSRGFRFLEGFGMTETAPDVAILSSRDAVRKNGSIGLPVHTVQLRIVDDTGQDVSPGQVGELVVRGPNVCAGYWNNAEATREAFRDSWFHTGDLARQDDEGFYYIVDRKKDMLISGGENVYPVEVEQVLVQHPKVLEVAVTGAPDERWGEVPAAFVVPKPGETVTLDELVAFCEGKLARFKIPKQLHVVDQLPRNATGKVLKHVLRARVAGS
ncbi:long-chain fatty acid--CoA ligase [Thermaerobacter sp. PB12/4term]|uniref:acyl-CoA synthetase n=1 Tax=Thermaerobacter sp. PB12/4term TaxID=2293838 RepID=UPI00193EC624|nr:long-chain fatty acid--CoA ligase [Thermaerobacter sp. PB12/4term]